ncbi:Malignant T-cell-amplified sequence 1 [Lemmus lemmus]
MTFFTHREEPLYPTLRLFQKYLLILPYQQVDKGAIKFALNVASIMYPGVTSGAKFYPGAVDTMVAIMTLEKQLANLCVGVMEMSVEDIEGVNRGIGIENIHFFLFTYSLWLAHRTSRSYSFPCSFVPSALQTPHK